MEQSPNINTEAIAERQRRTVYKNIIHALIDHHYQPSPIVVKDTTTGFDVDGNYHTTTDANHAH